MPDGLPGPSAILRRLVLFGTLIAAAQQQQPLQNGYRNSPQENAALRPHTPNEYLKSSVLNVETSHRSGRGTTSTSKNERAVATRAPAEVNPAVRAPPAGSAAGPSGGLLSKSARSLQDWEVENFVLLATVDGTIYARERETGKELWSFYSDRPMVETVYHYLNHTGDDEDTKRTGFMWIVEPVQDGSLYIFMPGADGGIQKLGMTVKKLADDLSPYSNDQLPFVYTAEKRNSLFTLNATSGAAIKYFSSRGSGVDLGASCRQVNRLAGTDDGECEPTPTLQLGRTEYTVEIHDRDTTESICTIRYFEWTPNTRDQDLQRQYLNTMDSKYIYSRHDGGIIAFDHNSETRLGGPKLLYSQKFTSSPVVRVFDVARPAGEDSRDTSLVVLPQPIAPAKGEDNINSVFVNCTEQGSLYALSEVSYPLVTDGAKEAQCYQAGLEDGSEPWADANSKLRFSTLVGVHNVAYRPRKQNLLTIGGPENYLPAIEDPVEEIPAEAEPELPRFPPRKLKFPVWIFPSFVTLVLGLAFFRHATKGHLHGFQIPGIKQIEKIAHAVQSTSARSLEPGTEQSSTAPTETKVKVVTFADETQTIADDATAERGEFTLTRTLSNVTDPGADETTPSVDLAAQATAEQFGPETPKPKKKTHRGQRGGKKKRKDKKQGDENADDDPIGKLVRQIDRDHSMQPDAVPINGDSVTDISGTTQLNNLIIRKDRILGYGSGGTVVYVGSFEGRDVAVKQMLPQYYELASQEVKLLQQSDDHPNVVRYFCQQKDLNFLYIAVELCQASLYDLYNDGGPSESLPEDKIQLVNQINVNVPEALHQLAAGLHHLHSLRIIHRDIKPQNILVAYPKKNQANVRFVISDFGLCKTLPDNASTLLGTTGNAGTVGWKAPELISQPRNAEGRQSSNGQSASSSSNDGTTSGVKRAVDIFSLGCVFFYVLTNGSHPFDEDKPEIWVLMRELNIKRGLSNFSKLRNLGDGTEEPLRLIEWMLAPEPQNRPDALQVMNHPFFWSPLTRLNFLCDVSDHWEREEREPPSEHLRALEAFAPVVIGRAGGDFLRKLDKKFIDTLGKQRKYTGTKMLDLLRALRNKKNHYADMPDDVKARVGELPSGYLTYWTARFPSLLMACYDAVRECELEKEPRFKMYFEGSKK